MSIKDLLSRFRRRIQGDDRQVSAYVAKLKAPAAIKNALLDVFSQHMYSGTSPSARSDSDIPRIPGTSGEMQGESVALKLSIQPPRGVETAVRAEFPSAKPRKYLRYPDTKRRISAEEIMFRNDIPFAPVLKETGDGERFGRASDVSLKCEPLRHDDSDEALFGPF